ncbi:transmembrane protein [Candidatus Magnetomorum sp. HK-1]|nr:transmembrane protein [Candidatus Magnetomorum sp. HK-1]
MIHTNITRGLIILWAIFVMAIPALGQDTNTIDFEKRIHSRMTSAGSGQGTGGTIDMHVIVGQPVPGVVGNGLKYQVRTNAEDMLARRLNYTLMANAGLDTSVIEGEWVELDATLSYDPANAIEQYQWTQLSGPTVELDNASSPQPQFIAPEVSTFGAYIVFQLTVINTNNVSAKDTVTIFVQNQIKHFTITVSATEGGSISPSQDVAIREGESVRFSFLAETGYYLSDVQVDYISIGPRSIYDFVDVLENHKIHAVFTRRPKVVINIDIVGSGSVDPEGPVSVNAGDDIQFSFTSHANHHVSDVIVNGLSKGPMNSLLLKELNDNVQLTVKFMLGDFHIQASSGENGHISPEGWISTYYNVNKSFEMVPDDGYVIDKVQIDGAFIDPISNYTFWNIADHHRIHVTFRPKMVIMADSGSNGTIEPSGMIQVETGGYKTFEMKPDDDYRVADVIVDGVSQGPISRYIFWDIQTGHTIEVQFIRDLFTIQASSGPYGKVFPEGKIAVTPGMFQFFEFEPDHGFRVASVKVDGTEIGPVNQYYFENIIQNHTLEVEFETARIIVQALAGSHGKIFPSGAVVAAEGDSQVFTMLPDPGYTIQNVRVDGNDLGQVNDYLFENLIESHTIEVFFESMPLIQATSMINGSLTPTGQIYVPKGSDKSFVIEPDDGYILDQLIVDGIPITSTNIFVFWNITESHTILASFRQFQLTATAGENGHITPEGILNANKGHDQTFDIRPNDGYAIADVLVDNVSQGPINRYTFWDIEKNHEILATFIQRPRHIVQASAGEGGNIQPSGEISILEGDYPEFVISPNPGYIISDVLVNNISQGPITNYIFANLIDEATIIAQFVALPVYTFKAFAHPGGSITPQGNISVFAGESISFVIAPESEYHIESVFVDGIDYGAIRSYPMLANGDHEITAIFATTETRYISGSIFDQEQPELALAGFRVDVWQNDRLQGSAVSDSQGNYKVTGLPVASDLIVSAWPPSDDTTYQGIYYINQSSMKDANPLIALADNLEDIDLYMPKVRIEGFKGQVRDLTSGIANAVVHLRSRNGNHSTSVFTDSNGYYQIQGLMPDEQYQVSSISTSLDQDFYFYLPGNQTPGIDKPDTSVTSGNLGSWIRPTTPLLSNIDIIFNPNSGATIAGHVYLANNNSPLSNIMVNAWSPGLRIGTTAMTDDNGAFILKGLATVPPVEAIINGYQIEIISDDYVYQAFSQANSLTSAVLVETGRMDIDFYISKQSTITGRITDTDNQGLSNALVQAFSEDYPWRKKATAKSDINGFYTLTVIPSPDYVLSASKSGYDTVYYNQTADSETAIQIDARSLSITGIDFKLDSGASIQGNIYIGTTNTKAPAGVWVTIRSENADYFNQCQTDAQGHFKMTGLDENITDYIIQSQREEDMPAYFSDNNDDDLNNDSVYNRHYAKGVRPSGIDRNLILLSGYQIRGRILLDNSPVYGVTVEARSETTGGWGRVLSKDYLGYQYEISGLPPGIYTLTVSGNAYQTETKTVTLVRQISYLDFILNPPDRKISGVVYGLSSNDLVWVKAVSLEQSIEHTQKIIGTDSAVPFSLKNLKPASDYRVYVYGEDYPSVFYPDQSSLEASKAIDLNESDIDNIAFHMPSKTTRRIYGSIQFSDNFSDGDSIIISARSDQHNHEKTLRLIYADGQSEENYIIEGLLQASDYRVKVESDICVDQYYPETENILNAQLINTVDQDAYSINFNLSAGATIQGTITGINDKDIRIFATSEKKGGQSETTPLSDGSFTIKGLAASDDYILAAHVQDLGIFYYHPETTLRDSEYSIPLSVINGNLTDIVLTIGQLETISGTVKSEQGNALAGVWVSCESASLELGSSTYSDDNGNYEITGLLPALDYVVTALAKNTGTVYHTSQKQENISTGSTRVDFVLQANTAYEITGKIVDPMNTPLEYVMVEIQAVNTPERYDRTRTNKEGLFTLKGLPEGTGYMLWVWPETDTPFAYYRKTNINIPTPTFFQITLESATDFGGVILDDFSGQGVQNAEITVFSDQTGFFKKTQTTSSGAYTITNAPLAADYRIVVHHSNYLDQELLSQSPHNALNIELAASGCIFGLLESSQTGTAIDDALIEIFSAAFDSAPDYIGTGQSDSDGNYQVCNLKQRDKSGNILTDYQVQVTADGYPVQIKGGLKVNEKVDFLMESHSQYELSGSIDDTHNLDIIIKIFDQDSKFIRSIGLGNLTTFHISGLNPESTYRLNLTAYKSEELMIDAWVAPSGSLVANENEGKLFATGQDIIIIMPAIDPGNKRSSKRIIPTSAPGPVQNLRSLSHPYVKISKRLRGAASAVPAEVTNNPNVEMTWDPPQGEQTSGYYYSFNQNSGHNLTSFNTVQKPPIRTRKITSRDLEGDDVSYYFHVAAVDQEGRIGKTTSIAFRIDSEKPTNVNVSLPEISNSRDIELILGADGATDMYVSNTAYDTGGQWESLATKKQWQLSGDKGSKNVYARFRDRARNVSKTMGLTDLQIGENQHRLTIKANENGTASPIGSVIVNANDTPEIEITPDFGFQVSRMTVDGRAVQYSDKGYTFSPITDDHSLDITFEAIQHTVYMITSDNGTISPQGPIVVNHDQNLDIQFYPDSGYALSHITIDGTPHELTSTTYTLKNIQKDIHLTAHFQAAFTLSATAGNNGSVQPKNAGVLDGKSHTFIFTPDPGYAVSRIWVDDAEVPVQGNRYTFFNVTDNHTLRVQFSTAQFNIVALAGINGKIQPSGTIQVDGMAQKQFQIQSDDGYMINQVLVDDKPVTLTEDIYTFKNVAENHKIFVTFRRLNYPPEAMSSNVSIDEDQRFEGSLSASDPNEDDVLIFAITTQAENGTINLNSQTGEFFYQPKQNYNGSDQFEFTVNDSFVSSEPAKVLLTINPVNDAPEAFPDSLAALEDSSTIYTLTAQDVDSEQLTFSLVSPPEKGKLTLIDLEKGICVYQPNDDTVGTDTFTFKVSDGYLDSNVASIQITIMDANDPPMVENQTITVGEDTPYTLNLVAVDPEDDPLYFSIVTSGQIGDATIIDPINGMLIYAPKADLSGNDYFVFSVTDGKAEAQSATVTVSITAINDPPVGLQQQINVFANFEKGITFTATDVDSSEFTYDIVETPIHGSLSGAPPFVLYHPNEDYEGTDQLVFSVSDDEDATGTAIIYITITQPPDAIVKEDNSVIVQIPAYASIKEMPQHGLLTGIPPDMTYQPDENYYGSDVFTYQFNDQVKSFSIYVSPVNDAPEISAPTNVQTNEGQALNIDIQTSDADGDDLNVQWGQPSHGSVSGNSSQLVYTPYPSYSGLDSIWIEAFDGYVQTRATIQVLVGKVNHPPEAKDRTIETLEDLSVEITLPAIDPDFDAMSYTIVQGPTYGTISGTPPSIIYQPNMHYYGQDSIGFTVYDGTFTSNIGHITLIIAPQNDAPVAISTFLDATEDTQANGFLLGSDVDLEPVRYQLVQKGQIGQAQLIDEKTGAFNYMPYENVSGTDILEFITFDTISQSDVGYVTINIAPVNDVPTAFAADWDADEDIPLITKLTAQDIDSSLLTFSIVDPPKIGVLQIIDSTRGEIRYTPFANVKGQDQFTFKVSDEDNDSAPAQITIDINSINDPPVSQSIDIQLFEDTNFSGTLPGSDVDTAILSYEIITSPQKGEVELIDAINGKYMYKPVLNQFGSDMFTYQISDGIETSETATVSVWITAVNDVPIMVSKDIEMEENQVKHISLMASDGDDDPLTFHLISQPENGIAKINGSGLTYTPKDHYLGIDTIQIQADDGFSRSKTASIQMWVGIHWANIIATEDEPISFTLPAGAIIVQQPISGNLKESENQYIFTPNPNISGDDSFKYKIGTEGNIQTNTIFIKPVNDRPVFNANNSMTINEDQTLVMASNIYDPDTAYDQLIPSVTLLPEHGSLQWDGEEISYQPDPDYNGYDKFTIRISDGFENSFDSLSVQVVVTPQNDAPRPHGQTISVIEDSQVNIHLTATDIENNAIDFSVYQLPFNGKLSGNPPNLIYTPNKDFFGTDGFLFKANDLTNESQPTAITLVVIGAQDTPKVFDSILNVEGNEPVSGQLYASDPDGDILVFRIVTQSSKGIAAISEPTKGVFTYTPNPGVSGEDVFTFNVSDSQETSNLGLVSIQISNNTLKYHMLTLKLSGEYLPGDAYDYSIVNTSSLNVVKQDQSNNSQISAQLSENEYAFYFSGIDYQPYYEIFNLTADMNADLTIKNNPNIFQLSIALQGDYLSGDAVSIKIMDANTNATLKYMEKAETLIGARLTAGVYTFLIQSDNYETYTSSQVYLDKKRTINAPLVRKINGTGELVVDLKGDYQSSDFYEYMIIDTTRGSIVEEGLAQKQQLKIPLDAGIYRIMIIAKNYKPLECEYLGQKLITLNPDAHIEATMIQSTFDPSPPCVDASHMVSDDGFSLKLIPYNFVEGLTVKLNDHVLISNTTHAFTYNWKISNPMIEPDENTPETGDTRYAVDFQFYDGSQKIGNYLVNHTIYATETSKENNLPEEQKSFEAKYGQAKTLAQAKGLFYPLIGTTLPVNIKDTAGNIQNVQINIPPLPLEYLFIDNSTDSSGGLLMYRSSNDTYQISDPTFSELHPKADEQLRVIVSHYCFDQNAGSGAMVTFQMAEGTYAGAAVQYNPILSTHRLSEIYDEKPPSIIVPLILNPLSPAYATLSDYLNQRTIANVQISEQGDKVNGFRLSQVAFTRHQDMVYFQMTHLTSIGFDVEKYVEPPKPVPQTGDSGSGGCFIGVVSGGSFFGVFLALVCCLGCFLLYELRLIRGLISTAS